VEQPWVHEKPFGQQLVQEVVRQMKPSEATMPSLQGIKLSISFSEAF
jgi:hypothetical protein